MFKSLQVERFRGFQRIRLENLTRCSLIIGRNNVGKTALTEALFLLLGPTNPRLALTLSGLRGIDQFRNDPEDMWGWLFYQKDLKQTISIQAGMGDRQNRSLSMFMKRPDVDRTKTVTDRKKKKQVSFPVPQTATTHVGPDDLVMEYQDEFGRNVKATASVKDSGLTIKKTSDLSFPTSVFVRAGTNYSSDNPERYSALEEIGESDRILEPLMEIEPRLKKLAVLVRASGPMIHADIGLTRMMPLPMLGDGIGRLLTILLAIHASKGGACIVDEIEVGFHYSVMGKMWEVISQAARDSNVQLFATTHSWECLKSAHEAFEATGHRDLFVHRLDRIGESIVTRTFDHEMVATSLESGLEMR